MTKNDLMRLLAPYPGNTKVIMDSGMWTGGYLTVDTVQVGYHKKRNTDDVMFNLEPENYDEGELDKYTETAIVLRHDELEVDIDDV
jgi:hypothetical protein